MLLKINPHQPQLRHIQSAVDILRGGGVIAYPTDSVYAVGCSILDKKAINQLYRIKDEDRHKPMSFICDSIRMASQYVIISNFAYRIIRRVAPAPTRSFWKPTTSCPRSCSRSGTRWASASPGTQFAWP